MGEPAVVYRVSGAGNDFLAVVEPAAEPSPERIRDWCRRGVSLGADGVLALSRPAPGRVRLRHWNADGGRSDLCLNGSRCAVELAGFLGWIDGGPGGGIDLATDAGTLRAERRAPGRVRLALPDFVTPALERTLAVDGAAHRGWSLAVGVPHFVLPWEGSLATAPVATLGPRLRAHPALGPAGANVDFVRTLGRDRLEVRAFERGVEGETLACGTGVVASVSALAAAGRLDLPVTVRVAGGFDLRVEGALEGPASASRLRDATLEGDARVVARSELFDGASGLPPPAAWS